ncbi:hypothetical protein Slin15195_G011790 [Septoria linicola]|uniref:Yeast cell wall synthesis Kre9/Knh1-like N-terminal domain-containing protein n=1 Tax=Septoria linicola TaxID=215465 RepID=A0A9Q9AK15_9PEZI|nr:hypothetical protein Slin14017_G011800 [Septoria linicola]USW47860.1 hypothetical protein Slin15195_G011790 [Septoria linicola]
MFTKAILVGALAALAAAQSTVISFTNALPAPAQVGIPFELTYATTDASSPITILLRKGASNDLQTVSTLTSAATGGSFEWTPASDLEDGSDYALQIQQGTEVNYLGPFSIEGGSGTGASTSSSSAAPPSYGESTSITLTATASANGTASRTFTAVAPYGTGNATIPRNTTMSSATLTRTSTPTGGAGSTTGAGFQGSQTGSDTAQSTGGASTLMAGSSAVALALGAVAALIMG